jgi:hypothetical protein
VATERLRVQRLRSGAYLIPFHSKVEHGDSILLDEICHCIRIWLRTKISGGVSQGDVQASIRSLYFLVDSVNEPRI